MTPLHRTVVGSINHLGRDRATLACVKLLVAANAEVEVGDDQGHLPIHWAAGKGRREIIDYLTDEFRFPTLVNKQCSIYLSTPLHWASGWGHYGVVCRLLEKGADPTLQDKKSRTVLHWAARFGRKSIVRRIIEELRMSGSLDRVIDVQDTRGRTALLWASLKGHRSAALDLISSGADINLGETLRPSGDGGTPLSYALSHSHREGHRQIVVELLRKGASILHKNHRYRSAVLWAARGGDKDLFDKVYEMTRAELGVLIDINDKDHFKGSTGFMLAASWGHLELLEHMRDTEKFGKLNVNATDKEGNTALMLAAGWGREQVVAWMCKEFGSDLDLDHPNNAGQTALDRATCWGKHKVIRELEGKANGNIEDKHG